VDACADGRERLVSAANAVAPSVPIDEPVLAASLYAPAPGDPDLILVFGGPTRLPPSLVWELAYGEIVFLDAHWTECNVEHIHMAIDDFRRRERRFGGVDS
jgi:undecaprenyl diphosphate synthase